VSAARATADRAGVRRNAVRCRAVVGGVFKGRACVAPATLRLEQKSQKKPTCGEMGHHCNKFSQREIFISVWAFNITFNFIFLDSLTSINLRESFIVD